MVSGMGLYGHNTFRCCAGRRHGGEHPGTGDIHGCGDGMTDNWIDQLRADALPPASQRPPRHQAGQKFLKGPILLDWLAAAAAQPGKALHVGLGIWFWVGIKRSGQIALSGSWLRNTFGIDRWSFYRALAALEKAGLVSVVRHRGRNPLVTLLAAQSPGFHATRAGFRQSDRALGEVLGTSTTATITSNTATANTKDQNRP